MATFFIPSSFFYPENFYKETLLINSLVILKSGLWKKQDKSPSFRFQNNKLDALYAPKVTKVIGVCNELMDLNSSEVLHPLQLLIS